MYKLTIRKPWFLWGALLVICLLLVAIVPRLNPDKVFRLTFPEIFGCELLLAAGMAVLCYPSATPPQMLRIALSFFAFTISLGAVGNITSQLTQLLPGFDVVISWVQLSIMNLGGLCTILAFYELEPFTDYAADSLPPESMRGFVIQSEANVTATRLNVIDSGQRNTASFAALTGSSTGITGQTPAVSQTASKLPQVPSSSSKDTSTNQAAPIPQKSMRTADNLPSQKPKTTIQNVAPSTDASMTKSNSAALSSSGQRSATSQEAGKARNSASATRLQGQPKRPGSNSTFMRLQGLSASGTGSVRSPQVQGTPTTDDAEGLKSVLDRLDESAKGGGQINRPSTARTNSTTGNNRSISLPDVQPGNATTINPSNASSANASPGGSPAGPLPVVGSGFTSPTLGVGSPKYPGVAGGRAKTGFSAPASDSSSNNIVNRVDPSRADPSSLASNRSSGNRPAFPASNKADRSSTNSPGSASGGRTPVRPVGGFAPPVTGSVSDNVSDEPSLEGGGNVSSVQASIENMVAEVRETDFASVSSQGDNFNATDSIDTPTRPENLFGGDVDKEMEEIFLNLAPPEAQREFVGKDTEVGAEAVIEAPSYDHNIDFKPKMTGADSASRNLFAEQIDSDIDEIFSNLAPPEAQLEVQNQVSPSTPHQGYSEHVTSDPEAAGLLGSGEEVSREIEDIFSQLVAPEAQLTVADTHRAKTDEAETDSRSESASHMDMVNQFEEISTEEVAQIVLEEEISFAPSEYSEPEYVQPEYSEPEYTEPEYSEPEYVQPEYSEAEYMQLETENMDSREPIEESDTSQIESQIEEMPIVNPVTKNIEVKEFGRLSARSGSDAGLASTSGTMKTVGKLLLDVQAVEGIIKAGEMGKVGAGFSNARVISEARGEGINALLSRIDTFPGVKGNLIVGHDGLVIASTVTGGMDKDALGALSTVLLSTSNLATLKLEIGQLKQMILFTEVYEAGNIRPLTTILTDVEVGILATFLDSQEITQLDELREAIHSTVHG